jgi:Mg2+ and Co2+ transporter CorA
VTTRWSDLVDPTREGLLAALPGGVDPDVVDALVEPIGDRRQPQPVIVGRGAYVFGVLVAMLPSDAREEQLSQVVGFVATAERLITVRRTSSQQREIGFAALRAAAETDSSVGVLVLRLVGDVADTYLDLLDAIYGDIDELEDHIEQMRPAEVRLRLGDLRHELLRRRRVVSATRVAVRRVLDGRIEIGEHALFPPEVERQFGDTYDTLVRVTEDLDIARDLLAGARDHLQGKISENQNEVGKKLTVIASLVLVPSFIVGFYGQNFADEFSRGFWTLVTSTTLIVLSTLIQLAIFRWRRWI